MKIDKSKRNIYLKQVDYRHRVSKSYSVPVGIKFNIRPSFEYRFRFNESKKSDNNIKNVKIVPNSSNN